MKKITHLLDTNILSNLIRHPQGVIAKRIGKQGEEAVATSLIVAAEVRYGCAKKGSDKLTAQANAILDALTILPLESPVDSIYGQIRQTLETKGTPIGPNDLLIAAHALSLDLTLVTANAAEFSRIPGLTVENWLAKSRTGLQPVSPDKPANQK
ncbi:MAG: type II toxin-antitoxin system VapC family toxin [Opitutales bacterium]|nr:type II toxin-antitoxin system VapC family toxin [Opitutales bacterium]